MGEQQPAGAAHGWSERGPGYASSAVHRAGPSLEPLLALARPGPQDRCLDIGTGTGHTAARLAAAAAEVVALDPEPGMLDSARERYGSLANLRFVQAAADDTGLNAASFDIVTARHTLHHHADVAASLREVTRLLKPGGRFVLVDEVTPDPRVDAWLDAVERARDATHVRAYTLAEWQAFLADAGLQWIVGDMHIRYRLRVDDWIGLMRLDAAGDAEVRRLFRQAGELERRLLGIEYAQDEALAFALPMALVLAVKPSEERTQP